MANQVQSLQPLAIRLLLMFDAPTNQLHPMDVGGVQGPIKVDECSDVDRLDDCQLARTGLDTPGR